MKKRAQKMMKPATDPEFELYGLLVSIANCLLQNLRLCRALTDSGFYSYGYMDFVKSERVVSTGPEKCRNIAFFNLVG